jgi:hypothetical protein
LNIAKERLSNQRLVGERFDAAADVVRWLGAVQAQDYPAAKWGLALRMNEATNDAIDAAFIAGAILRTHVMRPTWHFVAPEDLRWLLALTGPRVQSANARVYRRLELDDVVFRRARAILTKALEGGHSLTRSELGDVLQTKRIVARGQRLAFLIMYAELAGLICSGPLRANQHTYALLEERVPRAPVFGQEEALSILARRYFTSHGPATAHDFAWWSGLTVTHAKRALDSVKGQFESVQTNGKTYWLPPTTTLASTNQPMLHLLPNYDEHVVAYRDHAPSLDPRAPRALDGWGSTLTAHLVVVNGLIVGGWRRRLEPDRVVVQLNRPIPLRPKELTGLKRAARDYGDFLGLPVVVES